MRRGQTCVLTPESNQFVSLKKKKKKIQINFGDKHEEVECRRRDGNNPGVVAMETRKKGTTGSGNDECERINKKNKVVLVIQPIRDRGGFFFKKKGRWMNIIHVKLSFYCQNKAEWSFIPSHSSGFTLKTSQHNISVVLFDSTIVIFSLFLI